MDKERFDINQFGFSREGRVFENVVEYKIQIMRLCTTWISAIILCIVLVQLPTNTTSEYIQLKYNEVPKEVMISDLSFILQKLSKAF